jgi:hypothetical protein
MGEEREFDGAVLGALAACESYAPAKASDGG